MAKLQRKTQKLFAGDANGDQIAVFGSMKTGTPQYSSDVETLQSDTYLEGWSEAILNDKAPYLEEMNGVQYGLSYQTAYLLQEGLPEYDDGTNYSNTAIVKSTDNNGDLIFFHSLKAENLGNPLTDTESWARLYFTNVGYIGQPQITFDFSENALPENCIWLEGQALSRTLYAKLFAIYGTTYGEGDGSTTFNVPDCRERVLWGGSSAGYISAGLPNITIPVTGWGITGGGFGRPQEGRLVVGSGVSEVAEKLESLRQAANSLTLPVEGTIRPPSIKCRYFTRYQ